MNSIKYTAEKASPDIERHVVRNRYWGGADGNGSNALTVVDLPVSRKRNWYALAKGDQNEKS